MALVMASILAATSMIEKNEHKPSSIAAKQIKDKVEKISRNATRKKDEGCLYQRIERMKKWWRHQRRSTISHPLAWEDQQLTFILHPSPCRGQVDGGIDYYC